MNKEFVMRGQTADFKTTGATEILNFSGLTPGYAYRLVEFSLYPTTGLGTGSGELLGSITAGKTVADPESQNFNDDGLIGSTVLMWRNDSFGPYGTSVTNDLFLITQDLILSVADIAGSAPVNWQCRFVGEKLNNGEEALANYNQFTISND
jgi:hypothetical protein